jgi:hypothetical protein
LGGGALEVSKRTGDIAGATADAKRNVKEFIERRITTPTVCIYTYIYFLHLKVYIYVYIHTYIHIYICI